MKNFICLMTLFSSISLLQSCVNFLEEDNPNEITEVAFWSDLTKTNTGLTAAYGALQDEFVYSVSDEMLRSDMGFLKDRNRIPTNSFYRQSFDANTKNIGKRWESIYQIIWRANQVIEGLEGLDAEFKTGLNEEVWKNQMGQARFLRGLGHFFAHSVFNKGSVIIRNKVPRSTADFNKPLSTPQEVKDFFRADFEYAYKNLPAQAEEKSRVDAGTAATLLGTSYLYEGKYEEAKVYFEDVIHNSAYGYELVKDYTLMFTRAGGFNSESIFEINYGELQVEDNNFDEESFFNRLARYTSATSTGGGTANHTVPSAWLTEAYVTDALDTQDPRNYVSNGSGGTRLRKASFRTSAMMAVVNDEDTPYYLAPSAPIKESFGALRFSFFKHFTNHDYTDHESNIALTSLKSAKNFTLYRLGHVYMMQAECLIETGDLSGALALINTVRARWGLRWLGLSDGSSHDFDEVAYTQESLRERYRNYEKPLETSVEGFSMRNIDLQRWGNVKQRYMELDAAVFYLIPYQYTNEEGGTATRSASFITKTVPGSVAPEDVTIVDMEYAEAARVYDEDKHAYLPLPTVESLNNRNATN
ncbi:RagB/SusD family nutrient uptake outer membrane protein [Flavicella sediminum]|uniref:RagB/SusD family nutrient uptake outer membrane protein n=1 Tax=Flavicella sediminum TaxID=2585141 RepID=UPI001123EFFE|nr:RagB/SusD family nutrient uptake outer membrane protein [Flavicella sediminum]